MSLQGNLPWQSAGLDSAALILIKESVLTGSKQTLVLASVVGGCAYLTLGDVMRRTGSMGLSNGSWNLLSTASATIIGVMVYKEALTQRQMIGLALAALSLWLLDGGSKDSQ